MPTFDPSPQRIRLFKNERLEKLTLISPRTFAFTWAVLLPLIGWVGWGTAEPATALCLVAGGLFVWTPFEYVMHRYLFHLKLDLPGVQWFVFMIHGNHHDNPNDPMRGMMPLSGSLPIAGLAWLVCLAVLGLPGTWLFLGFMIGYVTYDVIHFACHQLPMRGRLASALKRHHMRHHYVDEGGNFAISAIFWDRLLGTRIRSLKR